VDHSKINRDLENGEKVVVDDEFGFKNILFGVFVGLYACLKVKKRGQSLTQK
jgi:hypothetical protein